MATTLQQSNDEVLRIWGNWLMRAPANFINNEATAGLMADFVGKHYGGVVSYAALDAAVEVLGSQILKLGPAATEKAEAARVAEQARQQRDYLESIAPQK